MATVEVFCGPMFAGKTTRLLGRISQFRDLGVEVLVIKHATDKRYADHAIATHDGQRLDAFVANSGNDIQTLLVNHPAKVVAIDEAQFFDHSLVAWVRKGRLDGLTVLIAGLDRDSNSSPFGPMPWLLSHADVVEKIPAKCRCELPAVQTRRKAGAPEGTVGGSERYESVCWSCYYA
jgi:thymidine kinase